MMSIRCHRVKSRPQRLWRADRKFIPAELYSEDGDFNSTRYDGGESFTNVPGDVDPPCHNCGVLPRHLNEIIVAVDRACKGNGGLKPQATIGVYFSKHSPWNLTEAVGDSLPTSQKAELTACLKALQKVSEIVYNGVQDLTKVVIKADSEYVVKGMTEWIFKWNKNGYKNSRGSDVVNAGLFVAVEDELLFLNSLGVEILFWHVLRSRNKEADAMANATLEKF